MQVSQKELFETETRKRSCLACRKMLPESDFIPEKTGRDGIGFFCIECLRGSNTIRKPPADPISKSKKHWTKI
jgi:hypothetical protein